MNAAGVYGKINKHMATPEEIKKWRTYFASLTTDRNVLDGANHQGLLAMLEDAKKVGYVDDTYISNYRNFRNKRLEWARSQPLTDPSTGQAAFKVNARNQTVPMTGADLFAGNRFMPDAGPGGAIDERKKRMDALKAGTDAEVKRLGAIQEALAPSSVLGNVGMAGQALTEAVRSIPTTGRIALSGLTGGLVAPPPIQQFKDVMLEKPMDEVIDMTPEQARLEAMKPARAFGQIAGQGIAPTLGGVVGGQALATGLTTLGVMSGPLAPIAAPVGFFVGSLGGAMLSGAFQESLLRKAYGSEAYEKELAPAMGQVRAENPIPAFAGDMANVLLQGAPQLTSGIGARRALGLIKSAWSGKPVTLGGTAGELGPVGGGTFQIDTAEGLAQAIGSGITPNIVAKSSGSKYAEVVSPLLNRFANASDGVENIYKVFRPEGKTVGQRMVELGKFTRDTPGASDFFGDLIGEQFGNLGQSTYDYIQALNRSKETGEPVNTAEMLANLALGSIFIGNNRFTDTVSGIAGAAGGGVLNLTGKVPGLKTPVEALKKRYERNLQSSVFDFAKNQIRQEVTGNRPTEYETEFKPRQRVTPGGNTTPFTLNPNEAYVSIGDGQVTVFNKDTGEFEIKPFNEIFRAVDDTANVETAERMGEAVGNVPIGRSGRGLDKLSVFGGQDIVLQVGKNQQQLVGLVRSEGKDEGHVVVREVIPVKDPESGQTRSAAKYSVLTLAELEEGNQAAAASLLESAGLAPAEGKWQGVPINYDAVDADAMPQLGFLEAWQEENRQWMPDSVVKEFPTFIQFDAGVQLQTRIIGVEKNGDLRVQVFAPSMTVLRVSPDNVMSIERNGRQISTATTFKSPADISDLLAEVDLSNEAVPSPDRDFDFFADPEPGMHSVALGENWVRPLVLTQEQRQRLSEAADKVNEAVNTAVRRGADQRERGRIRRKAINEALKSVFGDELLPVSGKDFTIGSTVRVEGPNGPEWGVVLDNTPAGPEVALPSMDMKPVVVQDEAVLSGDSKPKAGKDVSAGSLFDFATRGLKGNDIDIMQSGLLLARRLLEKEAGTPADETDTKQLGEMLGMAVEGDALVGEKDDAVGRLQSMADVIRKAVDVATNIADQVGTDEAKTSVEQAKQNADQALAYLDALRPVVEGSKFVQSFASMTRSGQDIDFYRGLVSSDLVADAMKLPEADRARFLIGQLQRLGQLSGTGDEGKTRAIAQLFGLTIDEGYSNKKADDVERLATRIQEMIVKGVSPDTVAVDIKQAARDVLPVLDSLKADALTLKFEKKPKPKVEKPGPISPGGLSIDEYAREDPSEVWSAFLNVGSDKVSRGRFLVAQLEKLAAARAAGTDVSDPMMDFFGFGIDGNHYVPDTWRGNAKADQWGQVTNRFNQMLAAIDEAARRDPANAERINAARKFLLDEVYDPLRIAHSKGEIKFKKATRAAATPKKKTDEELVAQGQKAQLAEREEAKPSRVLTSAQARAFRGDAKILLGKDGQKVKNTFTTSGGKTRNVSQSVIRKIWARLNGNTSVALNATEQSVFDALDMPDPETNVEWYRNAFQGISYLNTPNLQTLLQGMSEVVFSTKSFTLDSEFKQPGGNVVKLNDRQKKLLVDGGFVLPDGTIDKSGVRIYSATERGLRVGTVLAQTNAGVDPDQLNVWDFFGYGKDVQFGLLKVSDKATLRSGLVSAFSKTAAGSGTSAKKFNEQINAVVELFDTIIHGVSKRKVEMVIDGILQGAFSKRAAGDLKVRATREQMSAHEIDPLMEELRPLYNRLRELLGESKQTDLLKIVKNPKNKQRVAVAVATLVEEVARDFYKERMPSIADFGVIPEIDSILGQYVEVYDLESQTTINVVMAFKAANISTFVHEVAHGIFEGLPDALKKEVSSGLGHTLRTPTITHSSVLTYEAQEKFAYGLELSLANSAEFGKGEWIGTNASRGASKSAFDVIKRAGDAVVEIYKVLVRQRADINLTTTPEGRYTKLWQIPYEANGRVYLWKGAPIILKGQLTYTPPGGGGPQTFDVNGRLATIDQDFGTTRNPNLMVWIDLPEVGRVQIPNGQVSAIGGPLDGLSNSVMNILSRWIARKESTGKAGLVESTPAGREQALERDASGNIIGVVSKRDFKTKGDVTQASIDQLLNALGLPPTTDMMGDIIRRELGEGTLKQAIEDVRKLSRNYVQDRLRTSVENNTVYALTVTYAHARLMGRLQRIIKEHEGKPKEQRPPAYWQALKAFQGGTEGNKGNAANMAAYVKALHQVKRIIHANRTVMTQVSNTLQDIANKKVGVNWTIKRNANGKLMYNRNDNTITVVQRIEQANKKGAYEVEYLVNLNNGATQVVKGTAPDRVVVANAQLDQIKIPTSGIFSILPGFTQTIEGGTIRDINDKAAEAFRAIGLSKDAFRAMPPEFFIADALLQNALANGEIGGAPVERTPSVLYQFEQVPDVTPMAQFSNAALSRVARPEVTAEARESAKALEIIQFALQTGDVSAAMQNTGEVQTVADAGTLAAQRKWAATTLKQLIEGSAKPALDERIKRWKRDNPDKTPVLYRYEAYVEMEIFDNVNNTPMYLTDTEALERAALKAGDKEDKIPVRKERVLTYVFSLEPLKGRGSKRNVDYYGTSFWGANTEDQVQSKTIERLDIGDIWVNTSSQSAVETDSDSVIKAFSDAAKPRLGELSQRWSSQYNAHVEGQEAIDPAQAWKPMGLTMTTKSQSIKSPENPEQRLEVFYAFPKVESEPYDLNSVNGDNRWTQGLVIKDAPLGTQLSDVKKEIIDRLVNGTVIPKTEKSPEKTVFLHQVVIVPFVRPGEKKQSFKYFMGVRNERLENVVIEDTNNGAGYKTSAEAAKAAKAEHLRLYALSTAKQEEELSRRVANQFIDIIETGRQAQAALRSGRQLTADQKNALNILKQFTWYKSMEERLVGTYGQFATFMADALGATSPQTPVWQNYMATMFLMQQGVGKHKRRVALSERTIQRNKQLLDAFGEDPKGAMVVVEADVKRTLRVARLHDGLIRKFVEKKLPSGPVSLTLSNYKEVMADIPANKAGIPWQGTSWPELFDQEVPANKRAEVLQQFADYLNGSRPSNLGPDSSKDIQFRSFVNEVDDWVSPRGEVLRYRGKDKQPETKGNIAGDLKMTLAETVIPRNVISGNLYGSNSQNIVLALANEWLLVTEKMSPKARNFALNFIGLSKGATIDVWAARLTRRHLNEHYMGVVSERVIKTDDAGNPVINSKTGEPVIHTVTRVVDPVKYNNWKKLSESERKKFFRLAPTQEQGVEGGYVSNLTNSLKDNGFIGGTGKEAVEVAPADRQYTDVRDARISGEFGAANRVFANATTKVNDYLGKPGYMSAADLQAVVWFAEKAIWVQNGWTTAAGAGGSFEQMYNEVSMRSGGLRRGTMSLRLRQAGVNFTRAEQASLLDLIAYPFIRERERNYQSGVGNIQRVIVTPDGEQVLPAQEYPAMMANVMSRHLFDESVEGKVSGQVSFTAMMASGRKAFDEDYTGQIPSVMVDMADIQKLALQLGRKKEVFIPVNNASESLDAALSSMLNNRTVFGTFDGNGMRFIGSAVVDRIDIVTASDVPDQFRLGDAGGQYLRLELRPEQSMVNSKVFMHGAGGQGKDGQWGQAMTARDAKAWDEIRGGVAHGAGLNRTFVGTIPVESIPKANRKPADTILPRQPRIGAVERASIAPFIESSINGLVGVRDAQDAFISEVETITDENDWLRDSDDPILGKVPGKDAYLKVHQKAPESNLRYGTFLLLEAPVGQQRAVEEEKARIFAKVTKILTRLTSELPNFGYVMRVDAHAGDVYSEITGNKGAPAVEIVFSPEQFLRDYQPIAAIDGVQPSNADEYERIFDAYSTGDVNVIREYEKRFVSEVRRILNEIESDDETFGGIILRGETVYNGHAIPKEAVRKGLGDIHGYSVAESQRRTAEGYGIKQAVTEYANAINKTSSAETADVFYDGSTTERVASPDRVINDWQSFGNDTVSFNQVSDVPRNLQQGYRRIGVVASAYAGPSRPGFDMVFRSAMMDYQAGRLDSFQKKMDFISKVTDEEFGNAFSDLADADWSVDYGPAVFNGDIKPSILGKVTVKDDDFIRVIGRAATIGKRLAQPNVFITEPTEDSEAWGINSNGYAVVPTLILDLANPIDSDSLRQLIDSNPSVLNGAVVGDGGFTVEFFMIPDGDIDRVDAKDWRASALQSLESFITSRSAGNAGEAAAGSAESILEGRVRLWNIGSSENGAKGRFQEYEAVLHNLRAVAPDDAIPAPNKVTFTTNERLKREIEFCLSTITSDEIKLPDGVKFKRNVSHTQFQRRVAEEFDKLPQNALEFDPYVADAYRALVKELYKQYLALNMEFDFMPIQKDADGNDVTDSDGNPIFLDPYGAVSENAIRDIVEERHLYVYPTSPTSYGASASDMGIGHPLLEVSPFKTASGEPMLWNDVLRAVHDTVAHGLYGASFGKDGEEMAYATHALVTQDPMAIWALAMETRMQNSWYHYNRNMIDDAGQPTGATPRFADQKAALPPIECCFTGMVDVDRRLMDLQHRLRASGYYGTAELVESGNKQVVVPLGNYKPEVRPRDNYGAEIAGLVTTQEIRRSGGQDVEVKLTAYREDHDDLVRDAAERWKDGPYELHRALWWIQNGGSIWISEIEQDSLADSMYVDAYAMNGDKFQRRLSGIDRKRAPKILAQAAALLWEIQTKGKPNAEPFYRGAVFWPQPGEIGIQGYTTEFNTASSFKGYHPEAGVGFVVTIPPGGAKFIDSTEYSTLYDDEKEFWAITTSLEGKQADAPTPMGMKPLFAGGLSIQGDAYIVLNDAKDDLAVEIDLNASTIVANLKKQGVDLTPFMSGDEAALIGVADTRDRTPSEIQDAFRQSDVTPMAVVGGPAPAQTQATKYQPNALLRGLFIMNQLLRTGASGDASPILMQNFIQANLLENPAMVMRQLRLIGQVLKNPNMRLEIPLSNGTMLMPNALRGRKFFDEVLDKEVRQRKNYADAEKAGLSLAAITRERALAEEQKTNPSATYNDIDELGYNTDIGSDIEFMKHLPGQGYSERFFALSKDIVKMNSWDMMVDTLVQLGFNPTPWQYDANGNVVHTTWTRALTDLAHLLNVTSGDVRFVDQDEVDEKIARVGKLMFFAPRWLTSRLIVNSWGRLMIEVAGSRFGPAGDNWAQKVLAANGMSKKQLGKRNRYVSAMHGKLMYKAFLQWLALILGVYAANATNPRTMAVSIDGPLTKIKIGDYSFRAPGAILAQVELTASVLEGMSAFHAQKPGPKMKSAPELVWESVSRVLLSRASPVVSSGAEWISGKTAFGEPAAVPDEALDKFYAEVIKPGLDAAGIKAPTDVRINRGISERMLWWWLHDTMELYNDERKVGVEQSSALLKAGALGAYSAIGGRVSFMSHRLKWEREAKKKMVASPTLSEVFTGTEAVPAVQGLYSEEVEGGEYQLPPVLFGAVGSDYSEEIPGYE